MAQLRDLLTAWRDFKKGLVDRFWEAMLDRIIASDTAFSVLEDRVAGDLFRDSLDPELFRTEEAEEIFNEMQGEMEGSPQNLGEFINTTVGPLIEFGAPGLLLEQLGLEVEELPEETQNMVRLMNIVADGAALTGAIDIVGDLTAHAHIKHIGRMFDRVVQSSGFPQMVGFGVGSALAPALGPALQQEIFRNQRPIILDPDRAVDAARRGIITEEQLVEILARHGYSDDVQDALIEQQSFFPSPQTLVTWQAREVFEPETVERIGLDDEFDTLDHELFRQAGVNADQERNFWRAHWDQPSFSQFSEMVHRSDEIQDMSEEERDQLIDTFFKLVEVPPFWREQFEDIMFQPYTRVDLRRMYSQGVFAEEPGDLDQAIAEESQADPQFDAMFEGFRELGFDREHAWNMAKFYKLWATQDERSAYQDMATDAYAQGILTEEDLRSILDQQDMRAGLQDAVIERVDIEGAPAIPTKSEIQGWLREGVIEEGQAREWLVQRGYSLKVVDLYVSQATGAAPAEPVPPARRENLSDLIFGVGDAFANQLRGFGINTLGDLADANADALAPSFPRSVEEIQDWIDQAQRLIEQEGQQAS